MMVVLKQIKTLLFITIIGVMILIPMKVNAEETVSGSDVATGSALYVDINYSSNSGLYDTENNHIKTWKELIDDGSIVIVDGSITNFDASLSGRLVIDESVTNIESNVFSDSGLSNIEIPNTVSNIGNDAFSHSNLTIYCNYDSAAFAYAVENTINYVLLDATIPEDNIDNLNELYPEENIPDENLEENIMNLNESYSADSMINGTIEATIIDITVPLNISCTIDPNSDNGFVSSDITIVNNTRCPISLSLIEFSAINSIFEHNILPDGLPNGLTWNKLNTVQTKKYFSLGIYAKDSSEWNTLFQTSPLYLGNIDTVGNVLGVIDHSGVINLGLVAYYGRSFRETAFVNYQIVFIAELY